jgi:AraC-like DNA-binding protein
MVALSLENLKEHKQHGDSMLPIALYPVSHKAEGSILPHHWHNELEFIFFSTGQAVFTINEEEITVRAGDCIFVNSGQIHFGFSRTGNSSYFSVVFSSELLAGSFDSCRKYFDSILSGEFKMISHFMPEIPGHSEVISELKAIIKELTDKNTAYELALKSRFFSLFTTVFRNNLYITAPATKKNPFRSKKYYLLKNMLGYISQNNNRKISLVEISEFVNLTPQYLCKFFKEMTGHNIVDYINRYRVEKASTLLKVSNLSITDIALECGFDNISYFNRVFKKQTYCTPTEFRSNTFD